MLKRLLITALATMTLSLAPGAALVALADDPAPIPFSSIRPPAGVLRHVDAPTASPIPSAVAIGASKKELVIFVGGYQTCVCELPKHDGIGFGDYADRAFAAGFEVKYFGLDEQFPYDSYGKVDVSGRTLRDQIRSLAVQYSAIHIVAHSMGGVVADQAFAQGLSASDGVATYVALATPHSGSDAARAVEIVNRYGDGERLHRLGSLGGHGFDTRSDAIRDLASVRPIIPPAGVVRLDLRESTDELVTGRDANDPGVESRVLLGRSIDGHGMILTDPSAIDLTLRTMMTRRIPPDERSRQIVDAAERQSSAMDLLVLVGVGLATTYFLWRRLASGRLPEDFAIEHVPSARRKTCP